MPAGQKRMYKMASRLMATGVTSACRWNAKMRRRISMQVVTIIDPNTMKKLPKYCPNVKPLTRRRFFAWIYKQIHRDLVTKREIVVYTLFTSRSRTISQASADGAKTNNMPINIADVNDPGSKPLPGGVVYGSGYTDREMFSATPLILYFNF